MLRLEGKLSLPGAGKETNLTGRFDEWDLARLGAWVWEGYERDEKSRRGWFRRMQEGMNLALQVQKEKTFPWPSAANVAFPLVTIAAIQYHSRAYPALIDGRDIVKYRAPFTDPSGEEDAQAKKVACFMSYQALEEDTGWEEQHDRLLLQKPIVGCAFIKTQYAASKGHNESVLVPASHLVMDYYAKSVEAAARKTQIIPLYRNEVWERCAAGQWRDIRKESWYDEAAQAWVRPGQEESDQRLGIVEPEPDDSTPLTFLEQHCLADLDGDGYAEPYIITIEATNKYVVRIVARWEEDADVERNGKKEVIRIRADEAYTKYELIPSPDGGIYGLGFGILMGPLNESVNSLVNMLMDSGSLHAAAGGFLGRGAKLKGGDMVFSPFKWNRVDTTGDDLRKNIVPLEVRDPSAVLFSLLTFLVNYTQRIAGSTDPLAGENPGQNTPKSNLDTMVEQGLKIYSALYKRAWRSMKAEFAKLYTLNARYLPVTLSFADGTIGREDFRFDPSKICPAADPNVTSEGMRLSQAVEIANRATAVPGYDIEACEKNLLAAMKVDAQSILYPGIDAMAQKRPPQPSEKIQIAQMQITSDEKLKQMDLAAKRRQETLQLILDSQKADAEVANLEAQASLYSAQAEAAGDNRMVALIDAMIGEAKLRSEHLHGMLDKVLEGARLRIEDKKADAALIAAKKPAAGASK